IGGGLGATFIDGELFYLINIAPEFAFGKIGVGLDVNLRFNKEGKIRSEDFDDAYDYLRLIRYIRYGLKKEPVYVRLGLLDYSRLGHGFIMYNYRNSASYDDRKIGIEFDLDFEKFGFETVYSDVGGAGIFGLRGYVRPLKYTSVANVPVIGGLEVGTTLAADFNANANKTWGDFAGTVSAARDGGSLMIYGFDLGLPLLSLAALNSTLYFDYAQIVDFGNGAAAGIDLNFTGMGIVAFGARYERRWIGDQFIPSYFDPLYERDRYELFGIANFISKAEMLKYARKTEGYYGELSMNVLGTFTIIGAYYSPVGIRNAGNMHFELDAGDALPSILLSAGYDKRNVGQVFVLDANSILYAQIGYKITPWLFLSTLYQWTFVEEKDPNGNVIGFKTQRRIEPKLGFAFSF
ncbi:MAG: hypothetical protein WD295_02850, partial [Bacteroidota bacterium]